jgi:hypothetical protein
MVFKSKGVLLFSILIFMCHLLSGQEKLIIGISGGYQAVYSKTSVADRLTRYPQNYHTYTPGYFASVDLSNRNFFVRPSVSGFEIVHSHGVFNKTAFSYDSPKNKNIRNTNSAMDFNLDLGYQFQFYRLKIRMFTGVGWITTNGKEWTTSNRPAHMVAPVNVDVTTTLEIFSQAFQSQTLYSNFGLGLSIPIYDKLSCDLDIRYQSYFKALAANFGDYAARTVQGFGFGGEFASQLTGAWAFRLGIGYQFNR